MNASRSPPVRFSGELEIMTELEAGPVEVVNLMARRGAAEIELLALREPGDRQLSAGTHLLYAARGDCSIRLDGDGFCDFARKHVEGRTDRGVETRARLRAGRAGLDPTRRLNSVPAHRPDAHNPGKWLG